MINHREITNWNKRQQQILQMVQQQQGFVSIEDLSTSFNVTPQTIRRDINALCDLGMLRRFHGGAGLPSSVENIAYLARQVLYLDEKRRIAKMAAQHIPDQSSLLISIGTTTEEVAKVLVHHSDMRVITNNLNVANLLSDQSSFEVIITGGLVRHRDRGVVGEATVDFIKQFKVDFGIIGISGIDADGTLLDFDYREVRVSQAIIASSRRVLLVTDHSKFGRNAMVRLGHISEVNMLFTDRPPPEDMNALLEQASVQVYVAGSETDATVQKT